MAVNNQIASGSVVLTTSADKMVDGLNQSKAKVNDWANDTQRMLDTKQINIKPKVTQPDSTMLKGTAKAMKFDPVLEMGFTGGLLALGTMIAKAITTGPLDLFNAALERSKQLTENLMSSMDKLHADFLKRVDKVGGGGSIAGGDMIRERIAGAEKDRIAQENEARKAREALDKLKLDRAGIKGKIIKLLPFQEEQLEAEMKEAERRLQEAEKRLEGHTRRLGELKLKLEEPAKLGTFDQEEQDAFGKAQEEEKRRADDLSKGIDTLTGKLRNQAQTFGMTATQAEIYGLKAKGATEKQLAEAEALAAHMKQLEGIMKDSGPKLAGAIEFGSAEAFKAELSSKGFDVGDGNAIHKDNGKKLEKIAELNKEFNAKMEKLIETFGDPI
jgi:chromosome segregation ATPase